MIARIRGNLVEVTDDAALLDVNGITYSVMIARPIGEWLIKNGKVGAEVEFRTMYYIEGGVGVGNLVPRLVGFLSDDDLEFFHLLTTVQGLSVKRSLRALAIPVKSMARAIEMNDIATLKKLPEIGDKLARKIVMELKGKTARYALLADNEKAPSSVISSHDQEYISESIEVLVQLQYSRLEAETLVRKTAADRTDITTSDVLIQEIFRRQVRK